MCRLMTFSGTCSRCGTWYQWEDLSQELSCLEAKNNGVFGDCRRGISEEQHQFDQECEPCTAQDLADEGVGGMEEEFVFGAEVTQHPSQDHYYHHQEGQAHQRKGSKDKGKAKDDRDRDRSHGKNKRQRVS
jgi:hypothetical protein